IEATVTVVVSCSCVRECSLGRIEKLEGVPLERKRSVALIQKQQRPAAANHQQVLNTLVFEVGEQSARAVVEHRYAGFIRPVFESAIGTVAVEAIRKPSGLADVQIVESVIVKVASCYSVVTININTACAIQDRAPVICSAKQLLVVGVDVAEGLMGDINKSRRLHDGASFL